MTGFRLSSSPSQADLDRTYLMKNSFSARETSTYFSPNTTSYEEREVLVTATTECEVTGQVHYVIERGHIKTEIVRQLLEVPAVMKDL